MPFLPIEISQASGYKVELYTFYSDTFATPYTYTSADHDVSHNTYNYLAIPMRRTQPELSRESNSEVIDITLPRDNPLAKLWRSFVPPRTVWLKIEYLHISDSPTPEVKVFWQGKVRGVSWSVNEVNLNCHPIDTAFSRNGLRRKYGAQCQHQLYDPDTCKVPIDNFKYVATITGINGNVISSPQFGAFPDTNPIPEGWFVAGFLEVPTTQEVRTIIKHGGSGNTEITILSGIEGLTVGTVVNVYAGCNRNASTCRNKFNNIVNYGGVGLFLGDNPFNLRLDQI